ncbi:MAG TPA: transglutaminase domain-containing protein, partial [Clostridiales bacterium]|nr:transglutaminase domain-containing protein [Clostridiales bacterium]
IYKATDSSGNTAVKEVEFIVEEKPQHVIEQEKVDQTADQILDSIFEEGMTPREKARAIYDWVRGNLRYDGNYENNTDWVKAAFDGFQSRRGDCYVYFGVAKALLNRAELENLDIVKKGGGHYWSMVNLGEGWYHYDTTPRKTGGEFFMMTDAELEAYSNKYGNSHVWDRDKYPATPLE